jgi:uncharacterized protein (DUF2147 family)
MKSYRARFGRFAVTAIVLMNTAPARADVEGIWIDKDGGTVRIYNCSDAVCGSTASVSSSGATDQANRNRVGAPVLSGMRPSGPNRWTGTITVKNGNSVTGDLIELGPDSIRIESCVLFMLCGGENLTRVK